MSDEPGIGSLLSMLAMLFVTVVFVFDLGLTFEEAVVLMLLNIGTLIADK
jgi:hypothetical protein